MKRILAVAAGLGVLLVGCATDKTEPPAASVNADLGPYHRPPDQQPNAPIKELLSLDNDGMHCFATPADAVAAQLRASKAAEAHNAKLDQDAEGKPLKPSAADYQYVSDVGANGSLCYTVTDGGMH